MLTVEEQKALQTLGDETADDAALIKKVVADTKTKGIKQALIDNAADIVTEVKEDYQAIIAAVPVIKAGYKTTEFWLAAGLIAGNIVAAIMGKPIPLDVNAVVGGVIAVYIAIRGFTKKPTA